MISLHAVMFLTSLRLESRIENAVCLQQAFRTLCRLNLSHYFQAAEGNRHVNSQIIFITATETGFYLTWVECHATYDGSHKISHMKNEHEREQLIPRAYSQGKHGVPETTRAFYRSRSDEKFGAGLR